MRKMVSYFTFFYCLRHKVNIPRMSGPNPGHFQVIPDMSGRVGEASAENVIPLSVQKSPLGPQKMAIEGQYLTHL